VRFPRYPKRILLGSLERWVFQKTGVEFERRFRAINSALFRWPISVTFDVASGTYVVSDHDMALHIGHPRRTKLYRFGLANRIRRLQDEYMTDQIVIEAGDFVIDVGANVGEFTYGLHLWHDVITLSIEPESTEFECLRLNCGFENSTFSKCGLWAEDGELSLYSMNRSGDSSLIQPPDFDEEKQVRVRSLDSLLAGEGLAGESVKLLKLESEGAEPEVLMGSTETLGRTKYVTADVGPERGITQSNTLVEVLEILLDRGFRPRCFEHQRGVILMENKGL